MMKKVFSWNCSTPFHSFSSSSTISSSCLLPILTIAGWFWMLTVASGLDSPLFGIISPEQVWTLSSSLDVVSLQVVPLTSVNSIRACSSSSSDILRWSLAQNCLAPEIKIFLGFTVNSSTLRSSIQIALNWVTNFYWIFEATGAHWGAQVEVPFIVHVRAWGQNYCTPLPLKAKQGTDVALLCPT